MQSFHNVLNLPECVKQNGTALATYVYLADGTKAEVYTGSSPGTGTGYTYLGSLRYTKTGNTQRLESTPFAAGRFVNNSGGMQPYYHIIDHLGSIRVITDRNGTIQEQNDYYPYGGRHTSGNTYAALPGNNFKFNGKEEQTTGNLGYLDYGARMYDNVTGRWGTPDPLAEKYKSLSPYNYCLNNPVKFVDPDGRKPRIYIETQGVGHVFVTIGKGENTIVYTYGRYGELGKDKSFLRSTTPTGDGILLKLMGEDAKEFIQEQMLGKKAVAFEFQNGSDDDIAKYFDAKFNNSDEIPSVGKYSGNENARIIDKYNLFSNNCVTTSIEGVQKSVKTDLNLNDVKGPMALKNILNIFSKIQESNITKVNYEEIKKELNLPNGASGTW